MMTNDVPHSPYELKMAVPESLIVYLFLPYMEVIPTGNKTYISLTFIEPYLPVKFHENPSTDNRNIRGHNFSLTREQKSINSKEIAPA